MIRPEEYNKKENAKRLREGLENHIYFVAEKARHKYLPLDSLEALKRVMEDREVVRFPATLTFDEAELGSGEAARVDQTDSEEESYRISVHPRFEARQADAVALTLYTIVKINYGKIAKEKEALLFGALLLDMTEEAYAERLKKLRDEIIN